MKLYLTSLFLWVGLLAISNQANSACFGGHGQQACNDLKTGDAYSIRSNKASPIKRSRSRQRFGWMPMQSQKKLGNLTITSGYTAGRKRWITYGRTYSNGDYSIRGSDGRGPAKRTCIKGSCF